MGHLLEGDGSAFDLHSEDKLHSDAKHHSTQLPFKWQSGPVEKLLLVSATLIPFSTSALLVALTVGDIRSTGDLLLFVSHSRALAQAVVSILAAVLAGLNVYTANKLFNLATRINLLRRPFSLDMIKLARAVESRSFSPHLSSAMSLASAVAVVLFASPNILWTGALTPVLVNTTYLQTTGLRIPQYSVSSNNTWSNNQRIARQSCTTIMNSKGEFGNCPVEVIQSSLLRRAAQATADEAQSHLKNDNSQFSYIGRSYGVGASVGLVDNGLYAGSGSSGLLSYNFTEPGYVTSVSCFRNNSSPFHLEEIQEGQDQYGIPYIYYAIAEFPNAPVGHGVDFFSVMGLNGDANLAVLAAKLYEGRSTVLITAGSAYLGLNQTQCEVTFTARTMAVAVDVVNKTITVVPDSSSSPPFDSTSGLASTVVGELNQLSMMSTSLYTSIVGDALATNIASATSNTFDLSSPDPPSDAAHAAVAESVAAMLDELLLFVASSQFFVANDSSGADAVVTAQAVRLGDNRFVFAAFAVCALLMLAVAIEAGRTRGWKRLPKWDFADSACLVLAGAVAGDDIVRELSLTRRVSEPLVQWMGGGDQAFTGALLVRLGRKVAWADSDKRGEFKGMRNNEVSSPEGQLDAVSLWTESSKGVEPLE